MGIRHNTRHSALGGLCICMVNHEDQKHQQMKMEENEKKKKNNPHPEKKADDVGVEKKQKNPQGEDQEPNKKDAPPPPPQEVVLKVFMHCEGCAKKVRRSLKGFSGVEDVITDSKTHKVVVKGEKADPVKVMERIQMKTHRRVELISPIPTPEPHNPIPQADQPKEHDEKTKKNEDEGPKVITVVLKVHMHCDACSLAIKKRILRMKGVESVETDLKSSQVTVVGVIDPVKLVDYLYKRTGKHAAILKLEPSPDKKEEKEEKKEESKEEDEKKQKTDQKPAAVAEGGVEKKDEKVKENGGDEDEKAKSIGLKQNEFYHYPPFYAPKFAVDDQYYAAAAAHPPQIFSDENPNACTVM